MLGDIETEWREWAHKSFQSCGYSLQKEVRLNLLMIYQKGYLVQTRQFFYALTAFFQLNIINAI